MSSSIDGLPRYEVHFLRRKQCRVWELPVTETTFTNRRGFRSRRGERPLQWVDYWTAHKTVQFINDRTPSSIIGGRAFVCMV